MKDAHQNYWEESVACSLDEHGIVATPEQITAIANDMQCSAENKGMMFGEHCIPNLVELELKETKKKLEIDREKIICPLCKGKGRLIEYGPVHSSDSECWNCHGEGRLLRQHSLFGSAPF